jgi:hypothetical protein
MQGEIQVMKIMEAYGRRREWWARQRRDAEWVALKQWWQVQRQVAKADSKENRQRALQELSRVAWLYRAELRRAWPKWDRVRAVRWGME